jgi:cell filamentation protein
MKQRQKISIRFFNDREVRAIWDENEAKWWFSVLDVVAVLTDQDDYNKARNYWKYLKAKLKKENSQVVSATIRLKLLCAC